MHLTDEELTRSVTFEIGYSPVLLELVLDALQLVLFQAEDGLFDDGGVFLEFDTKVLGVKRALELLHSDRLVESLLDSQWLLRLDRVNSQVVCRSVGTTDTLDPSVRGLNLKVPAVLSVSQ